MKKSDIKLGSFYHMKMNGVVETVLVTRISLKNNSPYEWAVTCITGPLAGRPFTIESYKRFSKKVRKPKGADEVVTIRKNERRVYEYTEEDDNLDTHDDWEEFKDKQHLLEPDLDEDGQPI